MSEDHLARVRVYCDDRARNFHKRHGRHWLAEFRLRDPATPERHWSRWESVGHATRKPYRYGGDGDPDPEPDGAFETLVDEELYARGMYDPETGLPEMHAAESVWAEALDSRGRVVPARLARVSNPGVERVRFTEWVGEPPPPDWVSQRPLVQGALWTTTTVEVPKCPCGHLALILPTDAVVAALDLLAGNKVAKVSAQGLRRAVHACTS